MGVPFLSPSCALLSRTNLPFSACVLPFQCLRGIFPIVQGHECLTGSGLGSHNLGLLAVGFTCASAVADSAVLRQCQYVLCAM